VVTLDEVRAVAAPLPRSYEVVVRGRVMFRVGRIVYLDFSRDESMIGFRVPARMAARCSSSRTQRNRGRG
jgi:hypothetical protein